MTSARDCGLLCLGVLVALGVSWWFWPPPPLEYAVSAQRWVTGQGFTVPYQGTLYSFYGNWWYPRLLGLLLWVAGSWGYLILLYIQAIVYGLTAVLMAQIADAWLIGRWPAVVGLGTLLHPGNLYYVSRLHPHTFDVFLLALTFGWLVTTARHRDWSPWRYGGLCALTLLSRGTLIGPLLAWGLWQLWSSPGYHGVRLLRLTQTAAVILLCLIPILISGYSQYGRWIPLRTDNGANFWVGNHAGATGTAYTFDTPPRPQMALAPNVRGFHEADQSQMFTAYVLAWITAHPGDAVTLYLRKLWYFWIGSPSTGVEYAQIWSSLYFVYYGVLLACAVLGAWGCRRDVQLQLLLWLLLSYSLVNAAFYIEGRHRWEIEVWLIFFAVIGLARMFSQPRRYQTLYAPLGTDGALGR